MAGLVARHQVIAADQRVAQQGQSGGDGHRRRCLLQQCLRHRTPIHCAGLMGQQRQHQQRERPRRNLLGPFATAQASAAMRAAPSPAASPRARHALAAAWSLWRWRRDAGRSLISTFGAPLGSHCTQAGKRCRKWKDEEAAHLRQR